MSIFLQLMNTQVQKLISETLTFISDNFNNVANPCKSNPTNRVYYPHPRDATKFLQCDLFGRMFVIQCPVTEIYNQATTTCVPQQVNMLYVLEIQIDFNIQTNIEKNGSIGNLSSAKL